LTGCWTDWVQHSANQTFIKQEETHINQTVSRHFGRNTDF